MLAKNRPQPPPYKAIHPLKGIRMRMLEVIKPATKRRIQIGDDFRQTVPTRALGPHSNAILHSLVALFAYPASSQLEVIAQKVKALPRLQTISHMGLVGTKTQAMGLYPGLHFRKRRFGLLAPDCGKAPQSHRRSEPCGSPSAACDSPKDEDRGWPTAD